MSMLHPTGVFSAALTPLDNALNPDLPVFVDHAKRLIAQGCDGIALLGTTGEANSFSADERKAILEASVQGGIEPGRLLPGTGVVAIPETVALTKHALSLGVNTVVMLPPFYYKAPSEAGVIAAYSEIVERIGSSDLRVVLYHIPQMSAVPVTANIIEALLKRYPGTFTGIKDSAGDFANMEMLVKAFPGFAVLAGADPLLLPLMRAGGAGCITATSNLVAADLAFIYRNAKDPSKAAEVDAAQARVVAKRNQASKFAQMASLKVLLAKETGHQGWTRLRPPLVPLNAKESAQLLAA
ncbi:dihydrodipicolinate synthase family protein [Roseomonas sp. SSH11]|uniref:Dihydrodipicolinate synthase family protein n=1 Tax=Pararoseomonas baculiformis TaxID=2820812 RepID=A0ABS4ABS7_9PROT|nr:dihydrodipicolinate synthase family protein [Pararoseomonas baculiformis]MBP0444468.1 dihydrodipicolinate synthase family protein [Pararoseomonas baculiformis]